jgi:MFS family permease
VVAAVLGTTVCMMSRATSFPELAIGVTFTRALGQSALSVVSLATVGHWFVRRIDMAMAIYSIVMSIGFMIAFPLVGTLVQARGWRAAWFTVGAALLVGLVPLGIAVVRRNPKAIGLRPDGDPGTTRQPDRANPQPGTRDPKSAGYTLREALLTPAFWIFAVGAALYGLVASGIGLFNESILAERGLGPNIYYQTLVVTALTSLVGNFACGWLAAVVPLNRLMAASLFVLACGLLALPAVSSIPMALTWAAMMGIGGGMVMVLFFSVWPRVYGRRHLGRIQGVAQAMTVLASAVGPLLLAVCLEMTGSYTMMFYVLAATVAAVAATALAVAVPNAVNESPA